MVTRHKPTKALREQTHPACEIDYQKLSQAVVAAIINKQRDVIVKLPYFAQLAEDWPRGLLIRKDAQYNYFKCKSFKLMDWLYKHSYASYDAKMVVKMQRGVTNLLGVVDKMLATPEDFCHNDVLGVKIVKEDLDGTNGIRDANQNDD